MKIQLDTISKIIKVEGTVDLGELMETLERLLPKGKWKEFKLETQTIINWTSPIVIPPYQPYNPWLLPWWAQQPYYITNAGDVSQPVYAGGNTTISHDGNNITSANAVYNSYKNDEFGESKNYALASGIFNVEI